MLVCTILLCTVSFTASECYDTALVRQTSWWRWPKFTSPSLNTRSAHHHRAVFRLCLFWELGLGYILLKWPWDTIYANLLKYAIILWQSRRLSLKTSYYSSNLICPSFAIMHCLSFSVWVCSHIHTGMIWKSCGRFSSTISSFSLEYEQATQHWYDLRIQPQSCLDISQVHEVADERYSHCNTKVFQHT